MRKIPFILIDKSNLTKVQKFKDADYLRQYFLMRKKEFTNLSNFIVVKNEEKVVDISPIENMSGSLLLISHKMRTLLEEA